MFHQPFLKSSKKGFKMIQICYLWYFDAKYAWFSMFCYPPTSTSWYLSSSTNHKFSLLILIVHNWNFLKLFKTFCDIVIWILKNYYWARNKRKLESQIEIQNEYWKSRSRFEGTTGCGLFSIQIWNNKTWIEMIWAKFTYLFNN